LRRFQRVALTAIVVAIAGYIAWDRVETFRLSRAIAAIAALGEPIHYEAGFPPDIRANYCDDEPALQVLDRVTAMDFFGFGADDRDVVNYQYRITDLGSLACLRADPAGALRVE